MAKAKAAMAARALSSVMSFVAAIVISRSFETIDLNDRPCTVRFSYWNTFMFFMIAMIIGCVINFLVCLIPDGSQQWRLVVFVDMVVNVLLITSSAAAWFSFVDIKYGNDHLGWEPIYDIFPSFGGKLLGALITGLIGCLSSFGLFCCTLYVIVDPMLVT